MLRISQKLLTSGLAAFSFLGLSISIFQTWSYFQILAGVGTAYSFCDLNQTFDCTTVEMSRYAEFLPGFPLSGVAMAGYLFIFVLSVWQRIDQNQKLKDQLVGLTGVALSFSLIYFILMLQIGKLCLFCLFIDAINLTLFCLALSLSSKVRSKNFNILRMSFLGMTALVASILLVKGMLPENSPDASQINDLVESVIHAPVQEFSIPSDAATLGPSNAKVTIVEFGDFQCPPCKLAASAIEPLFKRYSSDLRLVFLNFPWATECNAFPTQTGHPFACEAAAVAMCAQEQGKFPEAYEALFENQSRFETGKISSLLQNQIPSIDSVALKSCLQSNILEKVKRDAQIGIAQKVNSTPTFFVNGRKVRALPTRAWIQLIDQLLKE